MNDAQRKKQIDEAIRYLKKTQDGYKPTGPMWKPAMQRLNAVSADLAPAVSKVPKLGPCVRGEKSILLHDCTHYTSGLGWPAFDEMGAPGSLVLAVEDMIVYDNTSSAQGGDAFYCRGASGMRYWYAHIATVPNQGRKFKKGDVMTRISSDHPRPHLHLAIDAKPLIGHHLISHDDYTHGAPLIGVQLIRALDT